MNRVDDGHEKAKMIVRLGRMHINYHQRAVQADPWVVKAVIWERCIYSR